MDLNDTEISDEYREKMQALAMFLDEEFNGVAFRPDATTGFALIVFPFNSEKTRINYISNGSREQLPGVLRELADRLEKQQPKMGNA